MQAQIVPTNSINEYIIRVVVEFRADGQIEQHSEQAALPKQQASDEAQAGAARMAPIFLPEKVCKF
jgi:hypothetical protein